MENLFKIQNQFIPLNTKNWTKFLTLRSGETKLGQVLHWTDHSDILSIIKSSAAKYVIFGVEESIGVKANFGIGGTQTAWHDFLCQFINLPSNCFFSPNEVLLLGYFHFDNWEYMVEKQAIAENEKITMFRKLTEQVNLYVAKLIKLIVENEKIPILIGGGHNLSYASLKGAAKALQKLAKIKNGLNVLNIDAHLDFRHLEGMHSGNGFHYAFIDNYLEKYFNLGALEDYIPQYILDHFNQNNNLKFISFEEIFIHQNYSPNEALNQALTHVSTPFFGLEIDIDLIANSLSSAHSPIGITVTQALQWIFNCLKKNHPVYINICEGAKTLDNSPTEFKIGKLLTQLVSTILKT